MGGMEAALMGVAHTCLIAATWYEQRDEVTPDITRIFREMSRLYNRT